MRSPRIRTLLCLSLALALGPAAAHGDEGADHGNLGSLGATADLVKGRLVVQRVLPDGPGDGTLQEDDVILGAGGSELGDTPLDVLGRMIDLAEKKGALLLEVERDGEKTELKLKLPKLGTYAGAFNARNAKIKKVLKAACTYVGQSQQGGGVWHKYRDGQKHRGDGITTATVMSALGLLAVDPKKYKKPLRSARGFVLAEVRPADLGPDATSGLHRGWPVALTSLFLAELYGQSGDKTVRKRLEAMLKRMSANQEPTGGWSHFPGFSEGPSYKSLTSLTALALIAQGIAMKVGVRVNADSVKKGLDYLEKCIAEEGALAYSLVNPATGIQCVGRVCGALAAFHLHGRASPKIKKLETYLHAHYTDVLESHPAPLTGVLLATILAGLWQGEKDAARAGFAAKLTDHLVPYLTLARHPEGYFVAQPTAETRRVARSQNKPNADRQVHDPYWATAILVMLHATTKPKLVCLGAKPRKR